MKRLLAFTIVLLTLGASSASAQSHPWTGDSILGDPEWRKSFLGSYGFLSGAEPQINPSELELLREVLELLKVNPRAASAMLTPQVGDQSSAALDFILANLQFQNGELELAIQHYGSAIAKFPDFRRAHKNLGLLLVQKSDFQSALQHLSRAAELGDRDGRTFGLMGYCYLNVEDPLAAETAYRNAVLQQPDTRDWKLGLARSLLAMERYKEAAALFGSLIEADPGDSTSWLLQANAYIGLEEPEAAAVNLEAVRMMGKAAASSLVLLGDIYMNAEMHELAAAIYLEVIRSDEGATQFETAYRAAQMLLRTGSFEEAAKVVASIESRYGDQLTEDDELRVLTLQAKLARATGREKEAAELLESIVNRDGTRGEALLELAAYHHGQGNQEKAFLLLERAARLDAFEYQALLDHAQLRVSTKDYAKAAGLLRKALTIKREPRVELFLTRVEQATSH